MNRKTLAWIEYYMFDDLTIGEIRKMLNKKAKEIEKLHPDYDKSTFKFERDYVDENWKITGIKKQRRKKK